MNNSRTPVKVFKLNSVNSMGRIDAVLISLHTAREKLKDALEDLDSK